MSPGRTTSGRVKVNMALEPGAYELLRQMAGSERGLGTFLSELIVAEARWRAEEEERARARRRARGRYASEVQEALASLDESEERYDRLISRLSAVVFEMTPAGVLLFVNKAITALTDYLPEDLKGTGWLNCLFPGKLAGGPQAILRTCGRGDADRRELTMVTRGGEQVVVELTTANRYGPDGQLEQIVGILVDITERRRVEIERLKALAAQHPAHEDVGREQPVETGTASSFGPEVAQQEPVQNGIALNQASERLALLHEIDRSILAAQSPSEIAGVAAEGLLRITEAARVVVSLWHATDDTFDVLAWAGLPHPDWSAGMARPFQPWTWLDELRRGRSALTENLVNRSDLSPEGQQAFAQGIRSHLAIPLMVGGQVIGHLDIARSQAGRLPEEDLALAQQIADSLAVALHNASLLEAEQQARLRLETIQAANAALTRSLDLDAVLEGLLDYLGELFPYDSANVMLLAGDSMLAVRAMRGYERWTDPALTRRIAFDVQTNAPFREMFRSQKSLLVADTAQYAGWERPPGAEHVRSWMAVPLVVGGRVLGLFSVDKAEAGFFRQEHVRLAEALAPQAAIAIQNAQLYSEVKTGREQLQALSRRLVELQEQERRALSRDLHDTSGQTITALKLGLGSVKRVEGCSDAVRARVDELLRLADTVTEDLHRLAVNLRPASLDRYGLVPALEQLLTEFRKQTGLDVDFDTLGGDTPLARLPGDAETALYRIVQESLTNISRYAGAETVSIVLLINGDQAQVIVEDDGRGFDVDQALRSGRLGLLGMRERAEMLGGKFEIESSPGNGTTVYAILPVRPQQVAGDRSEGPERPWPALEPQEGYRQATQQEAGTPVLSGEVSQHASRQAHGEESESVYPDARLAEAAELARAKALSDALVEITAGMARQSNARDLLAFVLARSAEAIGCDYADVLLSEGDHWVLSDGYRLPESLIGQRLADEDVPLAAKIKHTGEVVVLNEIPDGEGFTTLAGKWGARSGASIPLVAGGNFLGVVAYVHDSASVPLMPSEVDFLEHLAALVSLAMENIHLREVEARQRHELAQRVGELETLLALLPVGVAIASDPDGRVIRANPANAQLLGVPPQANISLSTGELPREAVYRVYQDGRELLPEELPMQMAARGRTVRDMVVELMRADGTSVTLLSSAVPLSDGEGKPRGAVGTFVDITEQRRALAEAEEARRTLEALLEYIPEGITIADAPDARIRYVSRYGQDLLGGQHQFQTAGEVATRWTVYEPDGITLLAEDRLPLVRAIRCGETVRDLELVQINTQGMALPLLCSAGPIRDREGKVTGGIVAWRDIAALKKAQTQREAALAALSEALQAAMQSEERYRSLFSGMTEGFALHEIICDERGVPADYRFLAVNPAFERLTGLKREDVEGRLLRDVLPGDDPRWVEIYGRVALTGEPIHFDNYSTALERWYDVYAYCPAPRQFAVIFTEITERKQAEARANRQRGLQEGINYIFETALTCDTEEELGRAALAVCERVTGSEFGFICALNAQGRLDDIAISDPGWEDCRIENPAGHRYLLHDMRVHGIYGRVLLDGAAFFTNDPSGHPDSIGTPQGHPPLTAFLGVPLMSRGKAIGMVGLGNRDGGYRLEDQEAAESLAPIIVEALERKRVEEQIRSLNHDLAHRSAEQQAILDAIADGLVTYDQEGRITSLNAVAQEMLGYSADDRDLPITDRSTSVVLPRKPDGSPFLPDEFPAVRALRGEVVRNQEMILHVPARAGGDLRVSVSSAPIYAPDGEVQGVVTTFIDVGTFYQMQADLAEASGRLRRSEATYRAIARGLPRGAVVVLDHDLRYLVADGEALAPLGLSREKMLGRTLWEIYDPDTASRLEPCYRAALAGESSHQDIEYRGRSFAVEYRPVRDEDGRVVAALGASHDITERVALEQQLRVEREAYRKLAAELEAILSALPNGLLVYDPAGTIARMNDVALEMLGYREETWRLPVAERVGTAVQAFEPDGTLCKRDEYIALRALRGEVVRNADQYIHLPECPEKDFWAILNAAPIWGTDGQLAGAVVTMTDTTKLHEVSRQLSQALQAVARSEAALQGAYAQLQTQADDLREAAERLEQRVQERTADLVAANTQLSEAHTAAAYREAALEYQAKLLENVNDAIVAYDTGLRITAWNRAAEELYGRSAEEAIGASLPDMVGARMGEEESLATRRVIGETGRWQGEARHTRRDGTPISVESTVMALRDEMGQVFAHVAVNRDITARKRAEEELRAGRERLQALSRRLVDTQERERRYVADQLYNEAGQVLAALKIHLGQSGSGEAAAKYFAETQDLLDRVMVDLHHLATDLRPAILDRLGLVSALRPYAEEWGREHGVYVEVESMGMDGIRLNSDVETAVYRVVQEALMNVALHAEAQMVGIVVSRVGGGLVAMIEDDGVGFDPTAAIAPGAIGLLSMHERVESVGGLLTIESTPGHGTCVIVEVPT